MLKSLSPVPFLFLLLSCNSPEQSFYNPVSPAFDTTENYITTDTTEQISIEKRVISTFKKRNCEISAFSYHTTKTGYIATFDVDSLWTDSASLAYLQVGAAFDLNMSFTKEIETDNTGKIVKERCMDTLWRYYKTYCNGTPKSKKRKTGKFDDEYSYNEGPVYLLDSPRGKTVDSICQTGTKLKAFAICNFGADFEAREEFVKVLYKKKTYWVQTVFNWAQHEDMWIDSIPPYTVIHFNAFLQETDEDGRELASDN